MEIGVLVTTIIVLFLFALILVSVAFACLWRSALACLCSFVSRLWGCCWRCGVRARVQPLPESEQEPPPQFSILRIGPL